MSSRRDATVLLRLSYEDRENLKQRAAEAGQSIQEYAMDKLLDKQVRYRPGNRVQHIENQERLVS